VRARYGTTLASSRAMLTIASVLVVAGCGRKPPPRTCSTEAPAATPNEGPLEIGMCMTDPPPDAGMAEAAPPDAAPSDATTAGG